MIIKESTFYKEFKEIYLKNSTGLEMTFVNAGAGIKSLKLDGIELLLSPVDKEAYIEDFKGKIIGRVCGRIGDATFTMNGKTAYLEKNNFGVDNIHGGSGCFRYREFSYSYKENKDYTDLIFKIYSPDGEAGFFGDALVTITYRVYENENKYDIYFDGETKTETLLNMTNHAFFNLNGDCRANVCNHDLFINSTSRALLNERYVAVGRIKDPKFDFSHTMRIGKYIEDEDVQNPTMGYDHPLFLDERGLDYVAARAHSDMTNITLEVRTTYPCCVLYTNNQADPSVMVNETTHDEKYLGFCLECQYNPNGINMTPAESGYFTKDRPYHEVISYSFTK